MRAGDFEAAMAEAKAALEIHPQTGRLWAILLQLEHFRQYDRIGRGDTAQIMRLFKQALREVPKSGEVWCEGARIALHLGHYEQARKFLDFSLHFTPQYGDSLVEYLRLELLEAGDQTDTSKLYQVPSPYLLLPLVLLLSSFSGLNVSICAAMCKC